MTASLRLNTTELHLRRLIQSCVARSSHIEACLRAESLAREAGIALANVVKGYSPSARKPDCLRLLKTLQSRRRVL